MGADLYIKSITDPATAKYTPLFDKAVEQRNKLQAELYSLTMVATTRERVGGVLPSLETELFRSKEAVAAIQAKVDAAQEIVSNYMDKMYPSAGYFRDSYNGSSLLWRLNLSWWTDVKGGNMTVEALKSLLSKVKSRKLKPLTEAELREQHCRVDAENTVKIWSKFYQNKKRRLIRFLERAIVRAERGEKVYFSL